MNQTHTKSGFVAIIGKPNVGKSTLLNHLLGKKLSITSRRPQTTRHRLLGIKTIDDVQIVYVDTPGIHKKMPRQMNRYMNRVAKAALDEVDVILFVVDCQRWDEQDAAVAKLLQTLDKPVILALNKIDQIKDRQQLLPIMQKLSEEYSFAKIVPISALKNTQLTELEAEIINKLPEDLHYFPPEQFTDRSNAFIAQEIIREKLTRALGDELPYAATVTIDALEEQKNIIKIAAVIWVERDGQKAIVIGKGGETLKKIAAGARVDLETFFAKKVFLQSWVKVKSGWSDDRKSLSQFGYNEE